MESKKSPLINEEQAKQIILASNSKADAQVFSYKDIFIPGKFMLLRSIENKEKGFKFTNKKYDGVLNFKIDGKTNTIYVFSDDNLILDIEFSGKIPEDNNKFTNFVSFFSEQFKLDIKEDSSLSPGQKIKIIKTKPLEDKYNDKKKKEPKNILSPEETLKKLIANSQKTIEDAQEKIGKLNKTIEKANEIISKTKDMLQLKEVGEPEKE